MALHNRKLSFTTPIVVGFAGILLSFMLIAIFVTLAQQKDFLEDYHDINRNFTHNPAINYTETLLRENDFILGRAAAFFARNDELNRAVNVEPEKGLTTLMQLQNMMPSVSSISLADTEGHYLRAPEVLENEDSRAFDPKTRPSVYQTGGSQHLQPLHQSVYGLFHPPSDDYHFQTHHYPGRETQGQPRPFISISPPWGSRCARWWRPYRGNFLWCNGMAKWSCTPTRARCLNPSSGTS